MKKLRVGVIGVGYLGTFHAEKYERMKDVDLVGVVDIDKTRAEKVAKALSTNPYQDHRDLIGKVDAVSIVAPTPAHFSISKDFLENDVDVLIEKPMTTTLEEADELIQISALRGLIVQVGHLERFNPAVIALKEIVKKPMFIESHRLSTYKERCTDVSVVLDLMIHDIDIILSFVKSEIKSVHAAGIPIISEHLDIANARLEFDNGCVANITASRISTRDERKIRLFQKDAYISADFANHEITVISRDEKSKHKTIPGMNIRRLNCSKGDALNDELKAFVKSVVRRKSPEVSGQVGRDALKIALDITEKVGKTSSRFLGR